MKNTGIHWTDDTVNPTSGCDGCELWAPGSGGPCYAGNLHENRLAKTLPDLYDPNFTNIRLIPGRMRKAVRCMDLVGHDRPTKPWLNGLRRKIFVGDLGDIFSADVPFEYLYSEIIEVATSRDGLRHDLQLLTKQPNRAAKFAEWLKERDQQWPDNVWIGTSITSRASVRRIDYLKKIPAKYRFLSLEPLIDDPKLTAELVNGINWLIVGGESNQGSYRGRSFHLRWARDIIALGAFCSISVLIKQLGANPIDEGPLHLNDSHGGDWSEWPSDLRVRQFPDYSLK